MNNIEKIEEYVPTIYVNDASPDLDETNLNKTEQAIKRVTDAANKAIDALKQLDREKLALSAISNVLSDDTNKVPSLALANTMQRAINDLNSNLVFENGVGTVNSDWATGGVSYYKIGKQCVINAQITLKTNTTIDNTLLLSGLPAAAYNGAYLIHGTTGYGVFKTTPGTGNITIDSGATGNSIFYFEIIYSVQ